ncbi:Chemotaxis protein CheY [Pseudoalteromonas haloplanktis]|uniref:Chemotaxis protein CheY n=1 Tax=Pseudoalteromonas haloplanktis TaxID=228 RepID=A0A9W4QU37_PSEHA|nr:response regulator [Pseudoalteromonas haloplanktis]MDB4332009.1 response regulator [bacterium]CAH9053277.1 Chemotaxis protein CheY [Pseudoalteromonas haloplanktis]
MMRFSILVCDDSTVARKQVMRCLKECIDADIQQATNGKEALEQLRQRHFDLLCLDLTMPEVDGIEVLEQIKISKIESYVLVISADIQQKMQARVAQLGAIDFIYKPINKTQLSTVLHKFGIY